MLETMGAGFMPAKAAAVLKGGRPLLLLIITWLVVPIAMRAGEPLAIEWAFAASSTNGFNLRFNRPVNPRTATNLANYQLNPPSVILSVSPQHGTNLQEYVVKLAGPLPHNPFVLVNGVADFSTPSQTLVSSQFGIQPTSGWLSAFYYGQVNGGTALFGDTLADLYAATNRFKIQSSVDPGHPDHRATLRVLESGPGFGNNYGFWLRGYLRPPETGNYIFHLSAGSQAALYLGDSADPYSRRLIAVEPVGAGLRDYLSTANRLNTEFGNTNFLGIRPDQPVNRSDETVGEIMLTKGSYYWVEIISKFGIGSDHVSVAWQTPSGPPVSNGDAPVARPFLSEFFLGVAGSVSIIQTNIPTMATEGESITMSTLYGGSPPFDFQWFRDCEPIQGATNRIYAIERVTLDLDGASFACRIRNDFSEASTDPLQTAERPTLGVVMEGDEQFITWPASYWDFTLQSAAGLGTGDVWASQPPGELNATQVRLPLSPIANKEFFRLTK